MGKPWQQGGKGAGQHQHQQWRPNNGRGYQPRQGGGFATMADQFNDMMGNLASLGQMALLGAALADMQSQQPPAA